MNKPHVDYFNTIKADKGVVVKFSHSIGLIDNRINSEYYLTTIHPNSCKSWRVHDWANIVIFSISGCCFIDWKDHKTNSISSLLLEPAVNEDVLHSSQYPIIKLPSKVEFRIRNDFSKLSILGCYSDIKHDPKELLRIKDS